nr:alpha-protein kinase 3 [Nerophis lumbriciformis]
MTSRRPMTRSFSANGRTSSFSEEDSSSSNGRTETRNNYLSSVRPENRYSHYRPTRSTLCTVMAQLTEDIQPCFETTLKSKAVSENCNVKFTCVVTGYPVPELKWYKDDMEMDRYCGLPKYEILKNGKIHSLHIYNCTLDDAAIYQVSASNSKGIVSCSGVLEVGTMSEFKIHQRFFAKLKQKAEKKRRDLEEQNKKGGTIQTDESRVSPEAPPRKRPVPPPEPVRTANESEAVKQQRAAVESNGVHSDVKETASAVSLDNGLKENIPVFEELVAKKKPKITNGVDAGFSTATSSNSRDHVMGNGSENRYDGGISLAQFLSETLQSQTAEENENSCEVEKPQEMDVCIENESTEKEGRHDELPVEKKEHETAVEKDLGLEREKEKERLQEVSHQAEHSKHFRKAVKDHDHHNIQSSLSTMLHTVKDFFFGKGKRDSYEDIDNKDKEQDQNPKSIKSSQSLTPPSYRLYKKHRAEVDKAHTDQSAPMEIDTSKEPSKRIDEDQQSASKKLSTAQERQINHAVKSPAIELPLGNLKEPRRQSNQETGRQVENMERSASEGTLGPGQQTSFSSLQVLTEAKEKHTGVVPSMDMVPSQAADTLVASTTPQYRAAEVTSSPRRNKSFPHTSRSFNQQSPLLKENQAPPFSVISALETSNLCVTPTVALQRGEIRVGKVANGDKPHKEVKYATSPKKSGLKSEEKSKELPNVNRPKVTVLTPPSIEKDKPDKDVNCTSKKLCMETEEKLKEVPDLNKPKVAVLMPPSLEEGKPGTGVNYSSKKSVKTAENLKEISHPVTSTTKVAVLTPPSMGEGKIDKKVNYPSTKSVETEPELKELPCPEIKRPEMAVFTPSSLEEAKPDKEVEYPSKQCVKTEEKLKELPCPKKNRPEITVFTPPMLEEGKTTEDNVSLEILKAKPLKQAKIDTSVTVEDLLRNRAPVERLTQKPPTHPSLSPGSIRKFMAKAAAELESDAGMMVPVITVDDRQSDKADEDTSGGSTPTSSTPTSSLSCESSPRLKRRDSLTLIRSATPEELASGARRKIFMPKPKEDVDSPASALEAQNKKESPYMSPSQARRAALLQAPVGQNTPPMERRSPLMNRRKATLEVPKVVEEPPKEEPAKGVKEEKVAEKKFDPLKAPQVIRKIRGEPFPDASGHLKLWCQFFNVLSDSSIKWFRDEEEILEVKRSAGDETQVALAIVLAASQDCGVYGCTIKNEYGTDTTDFLLSVDILSDILLRDDLEVGEEIEMTPLLFTKGLANSGNWGDKYFGRIMTEMANIGEGCRHKASRVKVIYGLNPIYESGSTCIIKVPNPIPYGTKQDSNLIDRNLEMTKQECKIQNMIREYCKIFAAEARVIENFGSSLEVIPQYLMYRPANSVPYATVEVDLEGVFLKYSATDAKGNVIARSASEMEQKCSTFQHWIHQWTHGNLLITRMEGVETKITNIRVVTKTRGYQSLTDCGSPEVFEHFPTVHQCNYYCGLLGLRPLKTQDQTTKVKGSRSPNLNRKLTPGSGSPQPHRKGHSPQMARKANESPKVTRKVQETGDNDSNDKLKSAETTEALEMR